MDLARFSKRPILSQLPLDLDGEAVARIGLRIELRAWLKGWTGLSIYRDGFRVWP